MLYSLGVEDNVDNFLSYKDLGYRVLSGDEKEFLRSQDVPLNTVGNDWRVLGDLGVNTIVHEVVTERDGQYIRTVECGWSAEYVDFEPLIELDATMADYASEFFMTDDPLIVGKLFRYDNKRPVVKKKTMNDDISYYEHQLFGSDKISKPYISIYNPSAGTVTRSHKHNLKPKFCFSASYFSTDYVQTVVIDRINELYVSSDLEKMFVICDPNEILVNSKCHCYFGRNANLMTSKRYSHAFEVNPYSATLRKEGKILGLSEVDGGYRLTYFAGDEKVQYEYKHEVEFYRVMESTFHNYVSRDVSFAYKRNDSYIYCCSEFEVVAQSKLVLEESPIIFDDPIQLPKMVQLDVLVSNLPLSNERSVYEGVFKKNLSVMGALNDGEVFVVDIDNGCTFWGRQLLIDRLLGAKRVYNLKSRQWSDRKSFDLTWSSHFSSPVHPFVINEQIESDDLALRWGIVNSSVINDSVHAHTIDLLAGATIKDGVLDVRLPAVKRASHFFYVRRFTLVYNFQRTTRAESLVLDMQDLFKGNRFGD